MLRTRDDYIRQRQAYVAAREQKARTFARAGSIIRAIRASAGPEELTAILEETAAERSHFDDALNRAIDAECEHRSGVRHD